MKNSATTVKDNKKRNTFIFIISDYKETSLYYSASQQDISKFGQTNKQLSISSKSLSSEPNIKITITSNGKHENVFVAEKKPNHLRLLVSSVMPLHNVQINDTFTNISLFFFINCDATA
jgi:hypothetical protein